MAKILYVEKEFRAEAQAIIDYANDILTEYDSKGYVLTLRQLYYQFVARDLLPNIPKSYERLSVIISDARLAGLIDWDMLIDRTRNLSELQHFLSASDGLNKLASWYHVDFWYNQKCRPEVWIEKDALVGVIENVCEQYDVPYFSCRGYTSQSEMWKAAKRLENWIDLCGQKPIIFHLGDHDPSGIDMSRDIQDRLNLFIRSDLGLDEDDEQPFEFKRLALNRDQIEEYNPPPNPAKVTDPRAKDYKRKYGDDSWELDALEPSVMNDLIENNILEIMDEDQWDIDSDKKQETKNKLKELAKEWDK